MYQYLKRFLNQQVEINVVFPDGGILKATLLGVDKRISNDQVYSIFNKILELKEITEAEIDRVIRTFA